MFLGTRLPHRSQFLLGLGASRSVGLTHADCLAALLLAWVSGVFRFETVASVDWAMSLATVSAGSARWFRQVATVSLSLWTSGLELGSLSTTFDLGTKSKL